MDAHANVMGYTYYLLVNKDLASKIVSRFGFCLTKANELKCVRINANLEQETNNRI